VAEKVWTAEELATLSPADVDALFEAGLITDLGAAPTEFLAHVRSRVQERIDATERSSQS
jgi:hypothetical protein